MKFETLLLAAGLVLPASGVLAEPVTLTRDAKTLAGDTSLSADELRRAVTGKTVYLDVSGFELPIHYLGNGRMSGSMGTVAATLSIGDRASDNGRWWIEANQLCQRWTSWLDSQTYCYKLTARAIPCNGSAMTAAQARRALRTKAIFTGRSQPAHRTARS